MNRVEAEALAAKLTPGVLLLLFYGRQLVEREVVEAASIYPTVTGKDAMKFMVVDPLGEEMYYYNFLEDIKEDGDRIVLRHSSSSSDVFKFKQDTKE